MIYSANLLRLKKKKTHYLLKFNVFKWQFFVKKCVQYQTQSNNNQDNEKFKTYLKIIFKCHKYTVHQGQINLLNLLTGITFIYIA